MKSEPVVIKIKGLQVVLKERKGSVKSIAKEVNKPNHIVDKAFKKYLFYFYFNYCIH